MNRVKTRSGAIQLAAALMLSLAGYLSALPQVARMMTGAEASEAEHARRRAAVVEAARRLLDGSSKPPGLNDRDSP